MYGIDLNDCTLGDRLTQWLNGQKKISLQENQNEIIYSGPDIYDGFGCFQFTQRIVARSRIILLETMERLIQTNPDIEICYANIDSLHFSLPTWDLEEVLGRLQKETSDQFGSFRIESVSERGLWLEPGRYWLYSQKVDRFRNRGIGTKCNPFTDHSMHLSVKKIGNMYVPFRFNFNMGRTMSNVRELIDDGDAGLVRQKIIEMSVKTELVEVLDTLEKNKKICIPRKMRHFEHLQKKLDVCSDPLPRDTARSPFSS